MRLASAAALLLAAHCVSPLASAATVDTSFDFTGQARDYLDLGTSKADIIADVAIAPSTGSLYTVGRVEHVEAGGPTFGIMFKRLSGGGKDTAFFNGTTSASRVKIAAERVGGSSALNAVAFDASYRGAVMLAGFNDLSNGKRCGVVYKVLDSLAVKGEFDSGFGTGGRFSYCSNHSADTVFNDIKVLPDGRALVIGTSSTPGGEKYPFLLRLTTWGTLDYAFSGGGSPGVVAFDVRAGKDDTGLRIAVGAQGYYVAGNSTYQEMWDPLFGDDVDLWVARFTTQGVLDTSFNGNGKRVEAIDLFGSDRTDLLADIAVDASGRLVMLGNINPAQILLVPWSAGTVDWQRGTHSGAMVIRLTASGARDTTFASTGMTWLNASRTYDCSDFCDYDEPLALLTLPDNRILVSGRHILVGAWSLTPPTNMTLHVVGSNGETTPAQRFTQWPRSEGGAMVRQADGKFLVAGQVRTSFNLADLDFALTRFFAP
jgi:uncharacterized delta-60 repeat protein